MRIFNDALKRLYTIPAPVLKKLFDTYASVKVETLGRNDNPFGDREGFNRNEVAAITKAIMGESAFNDNSDMLQEMWQDAGSVVSDIAYYLSNGKCSITYKNETTCSMVMATMSDKLTFADVKMPVPHVYINIGETIKGGRTNAMGPELEVDYYLDGVSVQKRAGDMLFLNAYTAIIINGIQPPQAPQLIFTEIRVHDTIDETIAFFEKAVESNDTRKSRSEAERVLDRKTMLRCIEFAIGTIAFLNYGMGKDGLVTTENEEVSDQGLQIPKGAKQARKMALTHKTYLLSSSKEQRGTYEQGDKSHSKAKHLVRGHWRMQPIGSRIDENGNSIPSSDRESKIIWIAPFWKNVDGLESAEKRLII